MRKYIFFMEPEFSWSPCRAEGALMCGDVYFGYLSEIEGRPGHFKVEKPAFPETLDAVGIEFKVWSEEDSLVIKTNDIEKACDKLEWLYAKIIERLNMKMSL